MLNESVDINEKQNSAFFLLAGVIWKLKRTFKKNADNNPTKNANIVAGKKGILQNNKNFEIISSITNEKKPKMIYKNKKRYL